jgi:hypothetical protein
LNCPVKAYIEAKIAISHIEFEGDPPLFNLAKVLLAGSVFLTASV